LRSKGGQIDYPGKPEVCRTRGAVTFYNRPFMMPSTCSTSLLYRSYAEQLACSLS
jgi:hypothetical protein